jgi:hypothetical protein
LLLAVAFFAAGLAAVALTGVLAFAEAGPDVFFAAVALGAVFALATFFGAVFGAVAALAVVFFAAGLAAVARVAARAGDFADARAAVVFVATFVVVFNAALAGVAFFTAVFFGADAFGAAAFFGVGMPLSPFP